MASPRLSASLAVLSAMAETWAIRISFGLMMAGMAGFVIYDLAEPASASASTEEVEPAVQEPPVEPVAAPVPTVDRRPPNRLSRLKAFPAPPSQPSEIVAPAADVAPDNVERGADLSGVRDRSSLRSFLGTPRISQRHDERSLPRTEIRRLAVPESTPTEPVPAPPPAQQPVDPPEQLVAAQPEPEQPVAQPEQPEQPEGQPPSPTDEPN